ncbi:hypothetical protein EKK58_03355 [Candidatus Dependentiae bacterium]|nr:MAG: hypothetical protein EKK58_03355 [Candidatus Dependentiae bacterium]
MLTILYEWKNSLTLFKKDTLLLLLYSWYKLSKQLYKNMLYFFLVTCFIWAILSSLHLVTFLYFRYNYTQSTATISLIRVAFPIFQYIVILLARPTLEKKDGHYIISKGLQYIPSAALTTLLYGLSRAFVTGLVLCGYMIFNFNYQLFVPWLVFFLQTHGNVWLFLWIWIMLFLLDFKPSIKNCFRSVWFGYKMALFNLPITLFLIGFLIGFYKIISFIGAYFSTVEQDLVYVLFYPIIIALIATIYIKRVHDQCSLYTGRGNA